MCIYGIARYGGELILIFKMLGEINCQISEDYKPYGIFQIFSHVKGMFTRQ